MSFRIRRFLFYSLVFLFALTGLTIVFYSRGWRINIDDCRFVGLSVCRFKIQKTGAIFIQTKPQSAVIKIDEKTFEDKSGLIQSGTLIDNLLPRKYQLTVSKNGYWEWRKNLRVQSGLVTEVKDILLVPREIKKESIDLPRIRGEEMETVNEDGDKIILQDLRSNLYYLYDLNNKETISNITLHFKNQGGRGSIKMASFHPFDFEKLIIESDRGLYILDILRSNLETIATSTPPAWIVSNSNLYYLKEDAARKLYLASFNLIVKTENLLAGLPSSTPGSKATAIEISASGKKIALLDNLGDLYLFDQQLRNFEKIAHDARLLSFSPDSNKIAFLDYSNKLNILFLEDSNLNNFKSAGEKVEFILEEEMLSIDWYKDSYHLLLTKTDKEDRLLSASIKLELMEIDDREPTNRFPLLEAQTDRFFYNPNSGFIYFLENSKLYRASFDE